MDNDDHDAKNRAAALRWLAETLAAGDLIEADGGRGIQQWVVVGVVAGVVQLRAYPLWDTDTTLTPIDRVHGIRLLRRAGG